MIKELRLKYFLSSSSTIIATVSSNMALSLASICASLGYKLIIVMPENLTIEKRIMLKGYGARVIFTPASEGIDGTLKKVNELLDEIPDSYFLEQFTDFNNPQSHYQGTGPEIFEALNGQVDALVCGVGTGGTISGAGEFLKERLPKIKIFAVEPQEANILSNGSANSHLISGLGCGFIPKILNTKIYDEVICVSSKEAYYYTDVIAKKEGLLVGISSGAALCACLKIASRFFEQNIVVIFPDTGIHYLSTGVFN